MVVADAVRDVETRRGLLVGRLSALHFPANVLASPASIIEATKLYKS
jgi:hypothetical protein